MPRRSRPIPADRHGFPSDDEMLSFIVAHRAWGDPGTRVEVLERFLRVFGMADRYPEWYAVPDWTPLKNVLDAWRAFEFMPPVQPGFLRGHHSVMKGLPGDSTPEGVTRMLLRIAREGLVAQPETTGRYSELPGAVFAVVDNGTGVEGLYNKGTPFVTFDLPVDSDPDWRYFRGYRPGDVLVMHGVPAELITGINGVPVGMFLDAFARWEPTW